MLHRQGNQSLELGGSGDVGFLCTHFTAPLAPASSHSLGLLALDVPDDDLGLLRLEAGDDGLADALSPAGDDHDLAFQAFAALGFGCRWQ